MVSIDTMNTQVNLRLPEKLIVAAKLYSEENGYTTIQDFIKQAIRDKVFDEISPRKLVALKKRVKEAEKNMEKRTYAREDLPW